MADVFISYSKKHAGLTKDLAHDLQAEGYSTWWDTSLLPGDEFPDEIKRQLEAAKAVIVIWTESSVSSKWVRAETAFADARRKLITVRNAGLDIDEIPLPFNTRHTELVTERAKIFAALARQGIVPSNNKPAPGGNAAPQPNPGLFSRWLGGQAEPTREGGLKFSESFRDFDAAPEMVIVPAGEFWMGSKDGEGSGKERPRHKVTIANPFAVGKYPVTFAEWDAALAAGGVKHKPKTDWGRGRQPVMRVSWDDAQAYVEWLSARSGQPYRLLSEAEWEYCCRAGSTTAYSFGDNITKQQAQFSQGNWNSGGKTAEVGSFPANAFGLHDMHGNVWEWCQDCWNGNYVNAPTDGSVWTTGDCSRRVLRGGSWSDGPRTLRAARRSGCPASGRFIHGGFRLARGF